MPSNGHSSIVTKKKPLHKRSVCVCVGVQVILKYFCKCKNDWERQRKRKRCKHIPIDHTITFNSPFHITQINNTTITAANNQISRKTFMPSDSSIRCVSHFRLPWSHAPTAERTKNTNQASLASNVAQQQPTNVSNVASIFVMNALIVYIVSKNLRPIVALMCRQRHSVNITVCVNNTISKNVNTIATSVASIYVLTVSRNTKTIQTT